MPVIMYFVLFFNINHVVLRCKGVLFTVVRWFYYGHHTHCTTAVV